MSDHDHFTRSKGNRRRSSSLSTYDQPSSNVKSTTASNQPDGEMYSQVIKTDIDILDEPSPLSNTNSNLTNVLLTQQQTCDDHRTILDSMKSYQIALDKLIKRFDRSTNTTSPIQPSSATDHAIKQLRAKQISQLFDSIAFAGSRNQDVVDWLDEFNRKCDDIQLDDPQRLSVARGLMKNDAKLWVDALRNTLINWQTFQQKLIGYFQLAAGIDTFSFSEQLYTRQQQLHESTIQYYHDIIRLCSKVDRTMDNPTRLQHLYRGLRPETKITIDIRKYTTPNDLLQELVRLEYLQKDFAAETHDSTAMMTYQTNQSSMPNELFRHNSSKLFQQRSDNQRPPPQPRQQRSYYDQQYSERGPASSSRPRRRMFNSYPSRSSPQYSNQHSSSSQNTSTHLNGW